MDIQLTDILPYIVGGLTTVGSFIGGRRVKVASDKKAEAEAKRVEIDNEEKVLQMQLEYIVKPLETKVDKLIKEIKKLRFAINKVAECPYEADCPVRKELQKRENENEK
ncbi:MAG: hypothetical protein LBU42_04275 [Prevotellaceae bacterium]|jgi:hypothetical protein|nr:hypothetical protein [Prevotellaceae bacterium]